MKKRLLSVFLAVVMVLGLMPTSVFAQETHTHCVCGDKACTKTSGGHSGQNTEWTAWNNYTSLPTEAGNYYLVYDVKISYTWECKGNINLCLNGKTITCTSGNGTDDYDVIEVASGASLTITDCQTNVGSITHASGKGGCGIKNLGSLTLWNGSITGNGLSVKGNNAYGAGVYNNGGTFTMNGGSITGNEAWNTTTSIRTSYNGGGVYNTGTFTINSGTISDNTGNTGGGVYNYNGGTFTMTGGFITGNTAGNDGGGVANIRAIFDMSGGTISGNTGYNGGGVSNINFNSMFTMTGGKIKGNNATTGYGGVYNTGTFKLSGDVTITDNKKDGSFVSGTLTGGDNNNVYVVKDYYDEKHPIQSTGLKNGASVGISGALNQTVVTDTTNTTGFTSDSTDYELVADGSGGLKLVEKNVTISGVTLLNEAGGAAMSGNTKVYDGKAVAYDDTGVSYTPATSNVELIYTWQEKVGEEYNNIADNAAPSDAGDYRLLVTAKNGSTILGTTNYDFTIAQRTLTITDATVESKIYDGKTTATITGVNFSGLQNSETLKFGTDYKVSNAVYNSANVNEANSVSFTVTLQNTEKAKNYKIENANGKQAAGINSYVSNKSEYSVNSNNWLTSDFIVTPKEGWQLSYTNTAEGTWVDTLTVSEENNNGTLEFYLRNKTSGIISEKVTENYRIDQTAPTGEVSIGGRNAWQEFVNKISFNLFYKNVQTVTITANDMGSGVAKTEYLVTADDLTIEQLADKTFTEYTKAFAVTPDEKFIVYVKLSDTAGNVRYLRSDGVVLDATAPVINGADNGKTYYAAVTLTITDEYLDSVTLNNTVVTLTDGKLTLNPANGEQTVIATDKAGNVTTLTVTVTANDGHNSHDWGEWISNGDNTHTRTCKLDAAHTESGECHGGTATCTAKAVCDDCKQAYGGLDPENHSNLKHFDAKATTTAAGGNIEYWYCDGCGKYFQGGNGKDEIEKADTVIKKLPVITKGDNAKLTQGATESLSFTSDAEFADFIRVEIDGQTLDSKHYTVASGSTIVTLNADYMATLSAGEHTLSIVSQSGTATAKFTLDKKAAETITNDSTKSPQINDGTKSPQTGDSSNRFLWLALFLASGGAVSLTAVAGRKKKYSK